MSLEVLKCPNCGAPMPTSVVEAVVVCAYCSRSVANPAAMRAAPQAAPQPPVAQPPAPPVAQAAPQAPSPQPPIAQPAAQQPAAQQPAVAKQPAAQQPAPAVKPQAPAEQPGPGKTVGKVAPAAATAGAVFTRGKGSVNVAKSAPVAVNRRAQDDEDEDEDEEWEWTEENIVAYARESLGEHDSLFYEPNIPPAKLKAARATHKATLDRNERVLVLFDDTVFGGADDGFIITTEQLAWKNIADDPKSYAWDEIDADEVEWSTDGLTVMGEAIQVSQADGSVLYPALGEFIYEMASMAAEWEEDDE